MSGTSLSSLTKRLYYTKNMIEKESYNAAQKNLYNSYWKSIEKSLIVPHDKYWGEIFYFSANNGVDK